ncbi:MAG: matrixin family metalloprotease [Acidobacteria bacterium]|nr:matrixin family metalloprotease [Acidobacteriota bacterium]
MPSASIGRQSAGAPMSRAWACISMLLAFSISAGAQDLSLEVSDLASGSAVVVTGRVAGIEARWDAATIYEYVTVQVVERLKGADIPATIVIKQLGGRLGTVGLHIEGQASFALGEDVLLFLTVRPRDGTLQTSEFDRGKWRLVPDLATGRTHAVPAAAVMTPIVGSPATRGVDLADVRALVLAAPAESVPFVATPPETARAVPAYTYQPTDGGPPARWHQADDSTPVPMVFQDNVPAGWPGGQAQLSNAIGRWNRAGTRLQLQLAGGGPVGPPCSGFQFTGDRRISMYLSDPCGELADDGTFGVGGGYFTTGDRRTINGVEFQSFIQGFVIINNVGPHLSSSSCFEDALTHKIGHAIGLGHSNETSAIMQAALPAGCDSGAANLGQDDIDGLRAIYPAVASGPTPPLAPTTFGGTVSLNTVTLQWTAATSGGPAETYVIEAGSAPGLANLAVLLVNAPSTTTTVGNVPQGVYYVRVRAQNVIATSGPSPEAIITVGPCTLPGSPQGFMAGTNDTLVSLAWGAPPAGGPVQGYTLAVGSAPGLSNLLVQPLPASPTAFGGRAAYGEYYARLFARNSCGAGPATPDIVIRVQPCVAAPNPPSSLAFTRNGNQVNFSWTPPAGGPPPLRYVFVVGSAPGAADLLVQPTSNAGTSFSAVGPSGTYFVRLLAQNGCGNSRFSNEVQVVIP